MIFRKTEYIISAVRPQQYPEADRPELAVSGRSNVGKSSLINTLVQRRALAHTSNTPGKTRAVHFYCINNLFFIVDLPGYGYARVSRQQQRAWSELVDDYLEKRKGHALFLHVVDLRHAPSQADMQMAEWIRYHCLTCRVVATKADKVPRGKRAVHQQLIASMLKVDPEKIFIFSAFSGEGKDALWGTIVDEISKNPGGGG